MICKIDSAAERTLPPADRRRRPELMVRAGTGSDACARAPTVEGSKRRPVLYAAALWSRVQTAANVRASVGLIFLTELRVTHGLDSFRDMVKTA